MSAVQFSLVDVVSGCASGSTLDPLLIKRSLVQPLLRTQLVSSRLYVCVLRQHNEPGFTHDVCVGGLWTCECRAKCSDWSITVEKGILCSRQISVSFFLLPDCDEFLYIKSDRDLVHCHVSNTILVSMKLLLKCGCNTALKKHLLRLVQSFHQFMSTKCNLVEIQSFLLLHLLCTDSYNTSYQQNLVSLMRLRKSEKARAAARSLQGNPSLLSLK